MTEHDKLREAINSLCSACQKTLVIGPAADRMTRTVWEDDLIRVLAAAEQSLTFRRLPLPGELDDEALSLLYAGCFGTQPRSKNESMRAGYRALYEHLTKPKTKMVDVWRVEYAYHNAVTGRVLPDIRSFETEAEAHKWATNGGVGYCIKITGPHHHEVPA